jgi:two-component system, OmpR family, alkaline phosphatase synthesis response regulator PhoP
VSAILIVEDEIHLARGLQFNLEAEGYRVDTVDTGEAALERLAGGDRIREYDVVVLDCMLPGKDGFTVARELREAGQFVPVLMLTARSQPADVLRGFESGADDYLPKPFELSILTARIRGLIRRREWLEASRSGPAVAPAPVNLNGAKAAAAPDAFSFEGITIDFERLELRNQERRLPLTLMEAQFLRFLVAHEGQPLSRKRLLEEVWGLREDTDTRAIDNFVVRVRRYIEKEPSRPQHLLTVRGVGYRFVATPESR